MVDNVNPTSQFHPYREPDAIPHSELRSSRLGRVMGKLGGLGRGSLSNVRGMAQKNPGAVLGGLAALVIGAGLMRRRAIR